jgi:fructose-bisphosphate aldolase, class I
MSTRRGLDQIGLSTRKKARLHRILYGHGLGNGTAMILPYDQGLEHGPRDFFAKPAASDPAYIIKLALEGGFNGIAIQIGLAEQFYWEYAGEVPLILKLNGKTDIPGIDPSAPPAVAFRPWPRAASLRQRRCRQRRCQGQQRSACRRSAAHASRRLHRCRT